MAEPTVASDLIWGVEAIAAEIGQPRRQVYWKLETGQIPAGKNGQVWVASRQALRKFFQDLTAGLPAPAKHAVRQVKMQRQANRQAKAQHKVLRNGTKKAATA